eukprot:5857134-Amphidinium_carterae.1
MHVSDCSLSSVSRDNIEMKLVAQCPAGFVMTEGNASYTSSLSHIAQSGPSPNKLQTPSPNRSNKHPNHALQILCKTMYSFAKRVFLGFPPNNKQDPQIVWPF